MKFTIERSVLVKALAHMQNVVERRPTVTIMGNVKMVAASDASGEWISVTAANSEIELTEKIPAKVSVAGALTASSSKLYDVVRKINDGSQIDFSFNKAKNQLQLAAGRARFNLATLPVEDFYSMPSGDLPHKFTLLVAVMKSIITNTLFASAVDEARHYLNSIYLYSQKKGKDNFLKAAATDGHRLACTAQALPEDVPEIPGVIVPRKTVSELGKLLDDSGADEVSVELSQNQARFTLGGVVMSSRLIDAVYPEYERVIPADNDKTVNVDADTLYAMIERVAVFSEKSSRIKLSFSKDRLAVTAASSDEGSAEEDAEVAYDSAAFEAYYNYRYLLDIVAQAKGGQLACSFLDALSPALFTKPDDGNSRYILMPMLV